MKAVGPGRMCVVVLDASIWGDAVPPPGAHTNYTVHPAG